jgi:hypothetical protein
MRIFTPTSRAAEDNRIMKKERDLLPWIFGGLSAAAIAVAFAAVSTHRPEATLAPVAAARDPAPQVLPAPTTAQAPAQVTAQAAPQAAPQAAAQASPPTAQPDSALNPSPPPVQTAAEPQVPGQIWECLTKGVKTFSNNPCGEKSTLLDVGPINGMSALPAIHYAGAYGSQPRYAAGYPDQNAPADADDYSDQYAADAGGNSYAILGVVPRRRPQQFHRPPTPPSRPSPPPHNAAPVRRY